MFPNTGLEMSQSSFDLDWNIITVYINKYKIKYTLLISDYRGEIYAIYIIL